MDSTKVTRKLDEVVGRAIRDEGFRKQLVDDPQKTLEAEGLSPADIDAVLRSSQLSDEALDGVSAGAGATAPIATSHTQFYGNLTKVFKGSQVPNLTIAAWSTDKTCNERG